MLRVLAVLLATAALLEGSLRFLLFAPVAASWPVARDLRDPGRYAHPGGGERWFVLRHLMTNQGSSESRPPWAPLRDDRVGWTSDRYLPGSYSHRSEDAGTASDLILLFGDSFAAGVASPESRFEALLEESPAARTHALLNYGTPGFGLDQMLLLAGPVIERHASRRPLVIVALLVDDDLDRCLLSFRDWPKPRFCVQDGRLVPPRGPTPTPEAYLADAPDLPTSYALMLLRTAFLGRPEQAPAALEEEKQELARLILAALVAELRSRDLCFVFVLFNEPDSTLDPAHTGWRQELMRRELARLDAPWVEVREELLRAAARAGRSVGSYFRGDKHLNDEGNRIAFETILRGLSGCGVEAPPPLWSFEAELDEEQGALALYEQGGNPFLGESDDGPRLLLRGGRIPTSVRFRLDGRCDRFRATVRAFAPGGGSDELELRMLVDGRQRWSEVLSVAGPSLTVELDLSGAGSLELVAPRPEGARPSCCIVLSAATFE